MKAGTAQKISNAILSCAAGFASFLFSLAALLYHHRVRREDRRGAGRRRLLPADQLHRLGTAEQRKRPGARRAQRPPAGGRGRRPRLAGAGRGAPSRCPSSRPRSTPCSPKSAPRSKTPMRSACTIRSRRFPTGCISAPKPTSCSAKRRGRQLGDAVRRPRPLQDRSTTASATPAATSC